MDVDEGAGAQQQQNAEAADSIPNFAPVSALEASGGRLESRFVPVPAHRYSPLQRKWLSICEPIVKHLKLQIRMNQQKRQVEIRTSEHTSATGALQKATDFVHAFILGFEVRDAIALIRLDDLFVSSFEVKDVKPLQGEHLSRAIGRISGIGGKTKFAIENATKTRIVLADTRIHLLGSFSNIRTARQAISRLILGSQPGKVYSQMRVVAARGKNRF